MLDMTSFGPSIGSTNKITKARGKVVKPILKKLSHSEKNSLDLDRGWDEQQVEQLENSEWDGGYGYSGQARDVSFGLSGGFGPGEGGGVVATGPGGFRAKLQHGRSGSQTSSGSGHRGGAFVHPFAQTPRTSTPPLSYANSLASFDNGRDCSPTITENEDDDGFDTAAYSHSHAFTNSQQHNPASTITSQTNLPRPSFHSQRTASFQDTPPTKPASLRINTGRSTTATAGSRFAHASHGDVHIGHSLGLGVSGTLDSPTSSLCGATGTPQQPAASQMSPLRTSLELAAAGFPRLRSRSEVDTAARAENIRAARRKFEERERVKEEKYDREMIRKRERRDTKQAARIEKGKPEQPRRPPAHRRITPSGLSTISAPPAGTGRLGIGISVFRSSGSSSRNDVSDAAAAAGAAHSTSSHYLGSGSPSAPAGTGAGGLSIGLGRRRRVDSPTAAADECEQEQMGFASRQYESVPGEAPPAFGAAVEDVRFEQTRPRRGSGAKRKTQSYWQGFILWLRTKLLRLSGR